MTVTRPEDHLPPASEAHGAPDKVAATLRAAEIAEKRGRGLTWAQIADEMGYADKTGPRNLLKTYASRLLADNVSEMRAIWNERHEQQARAMLLILADRNNTTVAERTRASAELTRIGARVARLNGLDAPMQVQVSAGLQAELADALGELAEVVLEGDVIEVTDEQPDQEPGE